ncbi:MAG: molybdopterin molybdenumtransferase MoeA [Gammaproteobacteria bacterium]|nr:MAG: molybdopterin molybdenumtransferase MoeA [Gammaproteobacteria bacterium]
MLTTAEATQAIAESMPSYESERVDYTSATGKILRQSVNAERDQPPFDRVMMDGIAVRFASLISGTHQFVIQGTQHAGDPVQTLTEDTNCIEIMTGGVLPQGSDCVIPVERISVEGNIATVEEGYQTERRRFVHAQGSDHRKGQEVLQTGTRISPMDIAIIASCGLESVLVGRQPVVRVISTGNELIAPGQPVAEHQIRMSNGPALVSMLSQQGFTNTAHDHLVDEPALLKKHIANHLQEADVLILSGGVSMGKADFVPQVLADLGVKVVFHKISQRPGKPMWFGNGPDKQVVFALPGNPVSALVCCRQYVLPALLQATGRNDAPQEFVVLSEAITFNPPLTCFLPVRVSSLADGKISATAVPTNTSGDFAALSGTDGYVELPKEQNDFAAGSIVRLHRWSSP